MLTNLLKITAIFILIVFFSQKVVNSQTIYVKTDLGLFDPVYSNTPELISIERFNEIFDGYLLIEIDTNLKENDNLHYCNILWLERLTNLNDDSSSFQYYPFLELWIGKNSDLPEEHIDIRSKVFCKVWFLLNRNSHCETFLYDFKTYLTTELFRQQQVWEKSGKHYIVYKYLFNTAIAKVKVNFENRVSYNRLFIPTSNVKSVSNVEPQVLLENGFKESKWKIELIN